MSAKLEMEWLECPECGLPALVEDRFAVPSTDGPIPHMVTVCPSMHRFCTTDPEAEPLIVAARRGMDLPVFGQ
jgi:hypothetical protein